MTKQQLTLLTLLSDGHTLMSSAKAMGSSQTALTKLLQRMEAHHGLTLVLRRGPSVTPTEELHMLAKQARKILANMRTMEEMVERVKRREEAEGRHGQFVD